MTKKETLIVNLFEGAPTGYDKKNHIEESSRFVLTLKGNYIHINREHYEAAIPKHGCAERWISYVPSCLHIPIIFVPRFMKALKELQPLTYDEVDFYCRPEYTREKHPFMNICFDRKDSKYWITEDKIGVWFENYFYEDDTGKRINRAFSNKAVLPVCIIDRFNEMIARVIKDETSLCFVDKWIDDHLSDDHLSDDQ